MSSGRYSAGSIAAGSATGRTRRSSGVIRPILGRLHCGYAAQRAGGAAAASSGRYSAGSIAAVIQPPAPPAPPAVIRPILGRLHCGTRFTLLVPAVVRSSGRYSAGSIAAGSAIGRFWAGHRVIRPILGRLHCGIPGRVPAPRRAAGHPADTRPAPLRPPFSPQAMSTWTRSSGRYSAGSIAAPGQRTPARCRPWSSGRYSAGSIAAAARGRSPPPAPSPSSGRYSAGSIAATGTAATTAGRWRVIRPILGRLHCGPSTTMVTGYPAVVIRPILGRLHCGWRSALRRSFSSRVIRPILGRLHCGQAAWEAAHPEDPSHPADTRPAPLRQHGRQDDRAGGALPGSQV